MTQTVLTQSTIDKDKRYRKVKKLRFNEYYNTQSLLDELHLKSSNGYKFKNLMQYITAKDNILLAYRNIKCNKGSKTPGVDGLTIDDYKILDQDEFIKRIQTRLGNYIPHNVRRVEIKEISGKIRPLGIPTIEDRILQQCIYQILEPICEAKFHKHSYGFRPNRSTSHAISRCHSLIHVSNLHYVVDVDIKGFFDNVNHGKLIKQMWALGIQDKSLIKVISKMLKAEIEGIGIPTKGTPQGGILSPLLSNIVLNELDWWISNQWETFETNHKYAEKAKYRAMKTTNLKEMFLVRYADDFKIFCRNYETAQKIYEATKSWMSDRLGLEISPEKSKITNLKKKYTNFLGFKLKVVKKGEKWVVKSNISEKAEKKIKLSLRSKIHSVKKNTNPKEVGKYNSAILGIHNYYKIATNVSQNFRDINYSLSRTLYNTVRRIGTTKGTESKAYEKFYGKYKFKRYAIAGITLFPIGGIAHTYPINFKQEVSNFTQKGRQHLHDNLKDIDNEMLRYLLENPNTNNSTEFNDNRISLYVAQKGKCAITKKVINRENHSVHHKSPRHLGGGDNYKNLILIDINVHKLIHATNQYVIEKYKDICKLNPDELKKVNELRVKAGNLVI